MTAIMLAVNPKYAELILQGKKNVEVRKINPKSLEPGDKIFLYATSPVSAIVGTCRLYKKDWHTFRQLMDMKYAKERNQAVWSHSLSSDDLAAFGGVDPYDDDKYACCLFVIDPVREFMGTPTRTPQSFIYVGGTRPALRSDFSYPEKDYDTYNEVI